MEIKSICFLAGNYPTSNNPKSAVFYQNLVHKIADCGIECRVIHPYPLNAGIDNWEKVKRYYTEKNNEVIVLRPPCLTFGAKRIGNLHTAYLTSKIYAKSAFYAFKKMGWSPDAFYGHFISPAGMMVADLSSKTGIPGFVAYGESRPWSIETIGPSKVVEKLKSINGYIAVSGKNKKELIKNNIATEDKIGLFPNGIDENVFYKRDKKEARKMLGWDLERFVVAFAGHFNERKGVLRLDNAVSGLDDVYVAYAGSGELRPTTKNIIHMGNVSPEKMPWFLSAADIFVLPTLHEGCCNAIIEALACGLPVISSRREFNYDILSGDNALLIDPESVQDIKSAILKLKNNQDLRNALSNKALETARCFNLTDRCHSIINWMEDKCC